jgi:hypothetical protein
MDLHERLALADLYGAMENQLVLIQTVRAEALDFEGYLNRAALDAQEAAALIRLTAHIRGTTVGEMRNVPGMLDAGRQLGVAPIQRHPAWVQARVDAVCAAFPAQPASPDVGTGR